jgi:hypothetical protein
MTKGFFCTHGWLDDEDVQSLLCVYHSSPAVREHPRGVSACEGGGDL